MDKFYLNNIGWQGIRIRKQHLLQLAHTALMDWQVLADEDDNKTSLYALDIASGQGYYWFELCRQLPQLHVELRDYQDHNLQQMQSKAEQLQLSGRLHCVQADAFIDSSYQHTALADDAGFHLAVASGIFELFADNTLIHTALTGMFKQLREGGYLIYTNQPWHPEQAFIAKTLHSHRGSDWIMRCRSQAEMDQLVAAAGFDKVAMLIDEFGIFTVSLAKKPLPKTGNPCKHDHLTSDS